MTCNYTALTDFLLSENPIIDSDFNHPLRLSAIHGNESVVRWFLGSTSANGRHVTQALFIAMENRHENLVVLLVDAGADFTDMPDGSLRTFTHNVLRSGLPSLLIHAILAIAYASESESESNLREAADRGHEGAVALLSYAETVKRLQRLDSSVYSSHSTHNSDTFKQVVAALARVPNLFPAFDLTLKTVEKRRTKILVKVPRFVGDLIGTEIFLDSYHAYIEDVPKGLSVTHKKAIKIRMSGEYSFTVVHQEESLKVTFVRLRSRSWFYNGSVSPSINVKVGSHIEMISFSFISTDECHVELPIS